MRRSTLFTIASAIVIILALVRFNYPKHQLAGSYYLVSYFLNNEAISFKSADGKFIPIVKNDIKAAGVEDSILFITKTKGDSSSYFIIDTRKDFSLANGQNVIGPISRNIFLKLHSNQRELKINWNIYKHLP